MRHLSKAAEHLENHYEVVVIGSGYGGAIAASRLARAKRQVCLMERGREAQPGEYPRSEFEALHEIQQNTPIGHLGSRLGLFELHLNDDVSALVGCGLGGTSLINAGVALRPDPRVWQDAKWPKAILEDLTTRIEDGYMRAEEMLRPSPLPLDFVHLPKLDALQKSAVALGMGEKFSRPPINVTFSDGPNPVGVEQKRCIGCGDCVSGCNYAAKNTTLMNYLPDAVAHGAEIFTGVDVRAIARGDNEGNWVIHYQPVAVGREDFGAPELFITAEIVIVAAGSIGSTQLLLRSKARGLALSDCLGERFTGNGDVLAFGYNTDTAINGIGFGTKPPGAIAPVGPCITGLVDNRDTPDVKDGFVIEEGSIPGAIGAIMPALLQTAADVVGRRNAASPVQRLREKERETESALLGPHRGAAANTQTYLVMAHDDAQGKMSLVDDRVRIEWPKAGSEPIFEAVNTTLTKATAALGGGTQVPNPIWSRLLGKKLITVHPLGGCGMGERAEEGVVDHAGRVFAGTTGSDVHDGLFVVDGSVMPTSLGVNPLLTISAIAERTCALLTGARNWTIDYSLGVPAAMTETLLGLTFTETMRGTLETERGDQVPMSFTVTIASDDLEAMLTDETHVAGIMGTVSCASLSTEPLSVTDGQFNLFVKDPEHIDHRLMIYRMVLHAVEGQEFHFYGVKTITDAPVSDAWSQTTTLAVTVNAGSDANGALIGRGTLHIELADFLKQLRTIDVTNAPDVETRLKSIARFGEFFAGVMWDAYGGVFAREQVFDPNAPPRAKRPLRVGPAEVYPVRTTDGVSLRLTRHKGGDKGPVLLLHGAGVSSRIFSTDLIDTNLLEYLYVHGYDCWLGDFRVSIDLDSAEQPSNADQIARHDHPALIERIRVITGAADVQVFAHCYGATTFTMALLAGIPGVRSVVLSQISAHIKTLPLTQIKAGLHLPDTLSALGVHDLSAYSDARDDWQNRLLDDALRLYPIKHGEQCCSAVCHRISFLYGLLYDHKNLSPFFHDNLHELFGVCNVQTFEHLARMVRDGHVVAMDGAYDYLAHLDRMNLPIAFIHGGDNQCFLPESTEITYNLLCKMNGADLYSRHVVDGYGHIDCIFGRDAATDVFPFILEHLEKTAQGESVSAIRPQTFRDRFVSLYQSAIDEVMRAKNDVPRTLALRPGFGSNTGLAASMISDLQMRGETIPALASAHIEQADWTCAKLAFELMDAVAHDDSARASALKADLDCSTGDPRWAETILNYVKYFGLNGRRHDVLYIRAAQVGETVLRMKPGARVALIGDWGTGTSIAAEVLQQVALQKPDVVIHLGDIYYSGTPQECQENFMRIVDQALERQTTHIPVYTLSGNHDMYSGGDGFYALLKQLNTGTQIQPASFFCLRSEDDLWQFIAMDTGLHDHDPFDVETALPYLEKDEEDWIVERIAEFKGKTILLSHHPLFSAFSQIGTANADGTLTAYNPSLANTFRRFASAANGPIAAWFWGHEHNLCIYDDYLDFVPGRCLGHGAIPVFAEESPYAVLSRVLDPPTTKTVRLGFDNDNVYFHGFAIVDLGNDGSATVDYWQLKEGQDAVSMFKETL